MALGERDLFAAESEFGREKVVVAKDEQAVVREQGQTLPLFRQLIPGEALRGEIERIEIKQRAGLDVLDVLLGIELFEFGIGEAQGVGLVGQSQQIGGVGEIQGDDLFEDHRFRVGRAVLATIVPFDGDQATVGKKGQLRERDVFAFEFFAFFPEGGGVGQADGVFRFGGAGEGIKSEEAGGPGLFATVLHQSGSVS